RDQLAALESLTDPSVNPHTGPAAVRELLERLQSTLSADAVALVQTGRSGPRVLSAVGLAPGEKRHLSAERAQPSAGWVAFVHHDAAGIEQISTVGWPESVSSLMVVPVFCNGQASSTIEVANERPHRATDWDVVLVRVVADRLASVVVQDRWPTDAVA